MTSSTEPWIDDAPPESGVRRIARPLHRASPAPSARAAEIAEEAAFLEEVGKQVFLEVWDLMLALQPLQGPWMSIGLGHMGAIALRALGWQLEEAPAESAPGLRHAKTWRLRWPELVPGFTAMDRLVGRMVDWICR